MQTLNKSKLCSVMSSIIFLRVFGVSKASCPMSLLYTKSKKLDKPADVSKESFLMYDPEMFVIYSTLAWDFN